jgi:DNA-binding MarR family transcriptional regulator
MSRSASSGTKQLGGSTSGEELIGFAATDADIFVPPECDEHKFRHSVAEIQSIAITFDAQLLEAAEGLYQIRRRRDAQFGLFFGNGLFCEPAWDVLLDLYINNGRKRPISVSSACLASAVPTTTAMRYISELVRRRLVVRSPARDDRRVYVLHLSSLAVRVMEEFLMKYDNIQNVIDGR